jgi:hypothetical protein
LLAQILSPVPLLTTARAGIFQYFLPLTVYCFITKKLFAQPGRLSRWPRPAGQWHPGQFTCIFVSVSHCWERHRSCTLKWTDSS